MLQGDLLASLPQPVEIIVANLPYVRDDELAGLSDEIKYHEPRVALVGGEDGLDVVRRLIVDAPGRLNPGGAVLVEVAPAQVDTLKAWIGEFGSWSYVEPVNDAAGVVRVLKLRGI